MKLRWIKTPWLVKRLFSNYVWDIPNRENKVYLTFDDGPTPEITKWTLHQLQKYNAKATFFCIGDNIRKYPEIFLQIIKEGHSVGNHTFNHLKGWKTATNDYTNNTELCASAICKLQPATSHLPSANFNLFRPPYGKIKPSQSKLLRRKGYKIIMWDLISYDYDATILPEQCLGNVLKNIRSGSIVVFHDSKKAFGNLEFALPRILEFLKEKGFVCEKID